MLHYIFMYYYNMSGCVVLDIQTQGKKLYVRYNMDANIVKDFWYEWM